MCILNGSNGTVDIRFLPLKKRRGSIAQREGSKRKRNTKCCTESAEKLCGAILRTGTLEPRRKALNREECHKLQNNGPVGWRLSLPFGRIILSCEISILRISISLCTVDLCFCFDVGYCLASTMVKERMTNESE